jgi:nitrogen fixation protein NifU and related proteins
MYSPTMLDHFQNPRNSGELASPAVTVKVNNPACGDVMQLSMRVSDNVITDVRFKTRGCVASIACGSMLTTMIQGKAIGEASRIKPFDIATRIGGLPPESGHASVLAIDALKAALKASGPTSSGA